MKPKGRKQQLTKTGAPLGEGVTKDVFALLMTNPFPNSHRLGTETDFTRPATAKSLVRERSVTIVMITPIQPPGTARSFQLKANKLKPESQPVILCMDTCWLRITLSLARRPQQESPIQPIRMMMTVK
jgi:hypothetical protein